MNNALTSTLDALVIGKAQTYRDIVVFPLKSRDEVPSTYMTSAEAFERRLIKVTEVGAGGSVPELRVTSTADRPVLMLDGEELAGAKQNRVLNTTVLIPPNSTIIIPVSCTERGRWSWVSRNFHDSGTVMSRLARARKSRSVSASLEKSAGFRSNQAEVWQSIAELHAISGVHSPTHAMRDVFEARKEAIEEASHAFPLVAGQQGLLVVLAGRVAGLDLLSAPAAYSRLHAKLVKSYVLDGLLAQPPRKSPAKRGSRRAALEFLADLKDCEEKEFKSVGLGTDCRYRTDWVVGNALFHDDAVVHATFFRIYSAPINRDQIPEPMSDFRRMLFRIRTEAAQAHNAFGSRFWRQ